MARRHAHELVRGATAVIAALAIALAPLASSAKAPDKAKVADAAVADVARRAEQLLDKLEYERAREVLESAVKDPAHRPARPSSKARLWALLGRARAELGDAVGTDEAFLRAVSFDRRVRLAQSTSPKILEALERARANAPAPGELAEPIEPVEAPRDEKAVDTGERPRPPEKGRRKPKPTRSGGARAGAAPSGVAKSTTSSVAASAGVVEAPPSSGPEPAPAPPPETAAPRPKATGPTLRHFVRGEVRPGRTVTLVIEHENLPKGTRLELMLRRAQTAKFKAERLVKTGTVATAAIHMDRPRVELFVRATKNKKVLAALGSAEEPLVISTLPPPPALIEAWSSPDERPALVTSSTTASSTIAATPPARTSTAAIVATTRVEEDDDTLLWVGIAGGALIVAGAIVLGVVLLSRGSDCEAEEGFGCTEVQVLPLVSF